MVWRSGPTTEFPEPAARVLVRPFSGASEYLSLGVAAFGCATILLAPLEGFVHRLGDDAAKLPALVFVLLWGVKRWHGGWASAKPRRGLVPALLLTLCVFFSAALSEDRTFTTLYTVRWLSFLAVFIVLVDVLGREIPLRWALSAVWVGTTVCAVFAVSSVVFMGKLRATGPVQDSNDLAYFLAAGLPVLLTTDKWFGAARRKSSSVIVAGVASALVLGGILLTLSRGGLIAIGIAVTFLFLRRAISWRLACVVLLSLLVGATTYVVAFGAQLDNALAQKYFIADTNVDTRELRWTAAADMLARHLLSGVGPGGFRTEYTDVSNLAEPSEPEPVAHEMYLEVGAELGLPALAIFLYLLLSTFGYLERARRDTDPEPAAIGLQGSLLAIAVCSIFLSEQYYLPLWLCLALGHAMGTRAEMPGTTEPEPVR